MTMEKRAPLSRFIDWCRQNTNGFFLALLLLTALGGALRLVKLGDYPGGFGQDEAVDMYDAWSLLTTGTEHHGARWPLNSLQFGDSPSTLPSYETIPFILLFGPTEFATRLPCALLNIAAIPLFGLLLFSLFRSRAAGIFGAALFAIAPWNIFFSRWAVSPGFVTFFQVAGLLLLIRLLTSQAGRIRIYGTAILTGFIFFLWTHQYLSQYFFAPFMIGIGLLLWSRKNWPRILVAGGVYSLFMLLAILSRTHDAGTAGRLHRESVFFTDTPWTNFWHGYREYLSIPFFFDAPKMLPLHQIPGVAHLPHLLIPFYLFGVAILILGALVPGFLLKLLDRPNTPTDLSHWRRACLWMLAGLLLAPLTGAFFIQDYYTSRMTHLLTQVMLIVAIGCAAFWYLLKRIPLKMIAPLFAICFAAYFGQQTVKTVNGLVSNNLYFKGWLQQGVPDVMRYLATQKVKSAQFPRLMQGYIYHLLFTPVHPAKLNRAEVSPPPRDPNTHWNYADVERVGCYNFYPDIDPIKIKQTYTLRHQVKDNDRVWYDLYERDGDWYVLPHE